MRSTTKSAISPGTIEIRSNPNQDISGLSRSTDQALNSLGKIFDKKSVQEKQELAKIFGEVAYEEVHKLSVAKGWDEGSSQKIALHALVGGIMSDMGGSGFASGAVGAGVNEAVQKALSKITDPDLHQWASYLVGAAAAKAVGGDAQTGGSTAASGTKNNMLSDIHVKMLKDQLALALRNHASIQELQKLVATYINITNPEMSSMYFKEFSFGETGADFKAFLKENFMYDWDAAKAAGLTDRQTWDSLWAHVSVQYDNILGKYTQNQVSSTKPQTSTESWGDRLIKQGAEIVYDNQGLPYGRGVDGDYRAFNVPGKGDQLVIDGADIIYDQVTGVPYARGEDGKDYRVYNSPTKGDKLVKDGAKIVYDNAGQPYALDENGKLFWTSLLPPKNVNSSSNNDSNSNGLLSKIQNQLASGYQSTSQLKDDVIAYKEQKDTEYAKNRLAAKGITPDDPKYGSMLFDEYQKAKQQSDIIWGLVEGDGAGALLSVLTELKAFKYAAVAAEGPSKATTVLRNELSQSKSSQVWGELSDGTNQGIKHFADYWELYPERIPSIAERLGLDPAKFAKTAEGFENFTNEALRITRTEGVQMKEIGDKKIYFMNGAENAKKGVVVIMKEGKLQSMMPSELRSFLKME